MWPDLSQFTEFTPFLITNPLSMPIPHSSILQLTQKMLPFQSTTKSKRILLHTLFLHHPLTTPPTIKAEFQSTPTFFPILVRDGLNLSELGMDITAVGLAWGIGIDLELGTRSYIHCQSLLR